MRKTKKELPLDDIVRAFVLAAQRVEKMGGYLTCNVQFGAKPEQPKPAKAKRS